MKEVGRYKKERESEYADHPVNSEKEKKVDRQNEIFLFILSFSSTSGVESLPLRHVIYYIFFVH